MEFKERMVAPSNPQCHTPTFIELSCSWLGVASKGKWDLCRSYEDPLSQSMILLETLAGAGTK